MASIAAKLLAGAAGKKAYEKSGVKKIVHKIPVIGDIASLFGFKNGGRVPKTGVYRLHKGEIVIPSQTMKKLAKKKPSKPSKRAPARARKGKRKRR